MTAHALPGDYEQPEVSHSSGNSTVALQNSHNSGEMSMILRKYRPKEILDLIRKHEGFRPKPYRDTEGNLTVGYGTNLEWGITEEQARQMAWLSITYAEHDLSRDIPWWREHSRNRCLAMLDMAYNLGINGLLGFRKMLAAWEKEDYETAAKEALNSEWAEQVGRRAEEIAEMIRRG